MAMRWTWMGLGMVLAACGPQVGIDDDSSSTGDPSPTTTSPQPSTSGTPGTSSSPPNPTTATTDDTATEGPSDSTVADETSLVFIEDPDAGETIECSVWEVDECPRGEKCMPWANDGGGSWNATRCSPIAPDPGDVGDACTVEGSGVSGIDDCEERSMCFFVDPETNTGVCTAFCSGSEAAPYCDDENTQCNINGEGILVLCIPTCDPLADDCSEGQTCVPTSDRFQCAPDASGEQGQVGDPCEFVNVCDPGLFCGDPADVPGCEGGSGCCTPYCDLTSPTQCEVLGPEIECVPWYRPGEAPPGYENLGLCTLPS